MIGVIAILRGVMPPEVLAIGRALLAGGVRIIEVPLNSPQPFESIALLAQEMKSAALIGAGTVLVLTGISDVADTASSCGTRSSTICQ